MSLRQELEHALSMQDFTDPDERIGVFTMCQLRFLRDHGQALAEAVADSDRMDWVDKRAHCLDWVEGEPIRRAIQADTGDEFYSDESWRNAIDKAMATPSLCVVCDEPNEYDRRSGVCARCQGIIEPDTAARSKTVDGGGV